MPAVPMPDAATEKTLDDARSQATSSLKGVYPDSMIEGPPAPAPRQGSTSTAVNVNMPSNAPGAQAPIPAEPDENSIPQTIGAAPPEPGPEAVPSLPEKHTFVGDLSREIGYGAMRAAVATARTLGFAADAAAHIALPLASEDTKNKVDDTVFNFIRDHLDSAYDAWKVDPKKTNAFAKVIGGAVEGAAPLMLGPAGAATIAANSAVNTGKESVDSGDSALLAATLALNAGLTTTAQLGIGYKDPSIIKRVAKWVGAGDLLDVAGKGVEILARHLLSDQSVQDAFKQVDPFNPTNLGINSVMQAIFGALHAPRNAKLKADLDKETPPGEPGVGAVADVAPPAGTGAEPPPPGAPQAASPETGQPEPVAPPLEGAKPPAVVAPKETPPAPPAAAPIPAEASIGNEASVPATAAPAGPKKGDRVIIKVGGEDTPVVIDGPPAGNKIPVRMVDEDGVVAKEVHQVPVDLLPKAPEPVVKTPPAPEKVEAPAEGQAAGGKTKVGGVEVKAGEESAAVKEYVAKKKADEAPAATPQTPEPVGNEAPAEAPKESAAVPNAGSEPPKEGTPEPAKEPAKSPLQQAADFYDKTNIPKPGKKRAVTVPEHVDNVAALGRALQEHVKDYPDADPKVIEHANTVARRAANLDELGEDAQTTEAMNKGRRGSHGDLEAKASDIKRAIHNLDHPDEAPDLTITNLKAEKLKAQAAKKAAKPAEPVSKVEPDRSETTTVETNLKAKQAEKVKSGIADVEDMSKDKVLSAGDLTRIKGAIDLYRRADPENVQDAHDNLQRVVHEATGGRPRQTNDILTLAREQRSMEREAHAAARRGVGKAMSDSVTDEDLRQGHNDALPKKEVLKLRAKTDKGDTANEMRSETRPETLEQTPIGRLHGALKNTGFWGNLSRLRDEGGYIGAHTMLDHLIKVAQTTRNIPMLGVLTKMREHMPDLPIRPVTEVVHPNKGTVFGPNTGGVFHPFSNTIQVKVNRLVGIVDNAPISATHTIVHEMVHGATSYELHNNPDGAFAVEVRRLLTEARARAEAMGEGGELNREGKYESSKHYGLFDEHEFLAEALTSPVFQDFLANSEPFAQSKYVRSLPGVAHNLLNRLGEVIAKLFGIKDPHNAALLRDAMGLAQRGMELQNSRLRLSGALDLTSTDFIHTLEPHQKANLERDVNRNVEDLMPGLSERLDEMMAHPSQSILHDDDVLHAAKAIERSDDPPRLQHEDNFRAAAGPAATAVARSFRLISRSGAIEGIRRTTRALTTYDGLVRSALRRDVFGHNEVGNPVRDYDEANQARNAKINQMTTRLAEAVGLRAKLSTAEQIKLGDFQKDIGRRGFAIEDTKDQQSEKVKADKKFDVKWDEMRTRWEHGLNDNQRAAYRAERDYNEWSARQNRKAAVDLATESFNGGELSKAQKSLLYSIRGKGDIESLVGPGKMIDVGDRNEKLHDALSDIASTNEIEGDYFHHGRFGDHVVQVRPEVNRSYTSAAEAEAYAQSIRDLSPKSRAKVEFVGGKHLVTGNAEYVSMHENMNDADAEVKRLEASGHDVGSHTQKILTADNADLSKGFQSLYSEAARRLDKNRGVNEANDQASEDVKHSLRQAFLNQMAARSAYAGSKLARRNVGGVKSEEMGRSFAQHGQSIAWNTGHMATVLKVGDALSRMKNAVKDDTQPQHIADARGRFYDEMQKRIRQEIQQYGSHVPLNSAIAKLGFLNYMTSPSHSLLYMTQNFTTAIPVAGARFGYARSMGAFGAAMKMVSGPAFRQTFRALRGKGSVDDIQSAILGAVAKDPRFGKWAKGPNSPLQQLIDRGIIHTSLSNQVAVAAKGGNHFTNKVMEYARIAPAMADLFNRVSTGLAALELHKGDVYRAGDFVKETHVDYSQENKSRAFKAVGRLWGGNSVTMFRSYITGMTHLLYSHVYDSVAGTENGSALGGRAEALKTVAGLMMGTALFAGVEKGFGLEPVRIAADVYHHLAGESDEYYDFDNSVHRAVKAFAGDGKLAEVINGGLPRLMGVDMSGRMGLSDLFFHEPPDLLALKQHGMMDIAGKLLGAGMQEASDTYDGFNKAMTTGRLDDWMKLVPVKAWQNVFDAYKAGTSGKISGIGAQVTQPSAASAITHLVGFRPGEEAKLAQKARAESDYKSWVEDRKYGFLKQWGSADNEDRAALTDKIKDFNHANPGNKITVADLIKSRRAVVMQEREAKGLPGRNPVVNELRSH